MKISTAKGSSQIWYQCWHLPGTMSVKYIPETTPPDRIRGVSAYAVSVESKFLLSSVGIMSVVAQDWHTILVHTYYPSGTANTFGTLHISISILPTDMVVNITPIHNQWAIATLPSNYLCRHCSCEKKKRDTLFHLKASSKYSSILGKHSKLAHRTSEFNKSTEIDIHSSLRLRLRNKLNLKKTKYGRYVTLLNIEEQHNSLSIFGEI